MKTTLKFEGPILVLALIFPFLLTWVYFVLLAGESEWIQKTAYAVGKTFQFALPVWWVGLVCRERWLLRRCGRQPDEGVLFGVLVGAALLVLYLAWFSRFDGILGPNSDANAAIVTKIEGFGLGIYQLAAVGFFYSIVHSGLEEYYWRWFVFGRMKRFMPWFWAMIVSSLGFMAHHVLLLGTYFGYDSPYCWLGSLGVAVGGLYWCWLYQRKDSIWGPWIGHGLIDAAIFMIGIGIMIPVYWPIR